MLDDQPAVLDAISVVLKAAGFTAVGCTDPAEFVNQCLQWNPLCVFLEAVLPNASGLDILRNLRSGGYDGPVIMMSGASDVTTAVRAIKLGAADFIEKPFHGSVLVARLKAALSRDEPIEARPVFHLAGRPPLTWGEREVLLGLIEGKSNRQMAQELGLSPRTIESRRAKVMKKVGTKSSAELVRIAIAAMRPRS